MVKGDEFRNTKNIPDKNLHCCSGPAAVVLLACPHCIRSELAGAVALVAAVANPAADDREVVADAYYVYVL